MVAPAKAAANLRQRPQRQGFREIHRDLTRTDHIGGAARGQEVAAADIILARDDPLDLLDLDPLGLLRADQIADFAFRHFERHRLAGELGMGEQAIERAFEIAAVMGDGLGDEGHHRFRHIEARMMDLGRRDPRVEDFEPQLFAERTHLDHEPGRQPRAHAVVEAFEIGRRTVGRDHDLAAGVDQRIERVAELGLDILAGEELQVVDHQHVDAAQGLFEGERRLRLERRHEAVHELLGGEIEHLALAAGIARPGHRVQEMGLAQSHAGMDVERIEHHDVAAARDRDLLGRRMRERVGAPDHIALEGQARIERRAAERVMRRRHGRRDAAQLAAVEPQRVRVRSRRPACPAWLWACWSAAPPSGRSARCAAPLPSSACQQLSTRSL